ncbi:MAG TPA: M28 family peptidase [Cytophagaceae bacterium]|nr:M28 family peptidase [Cytophagaceae bacterium]
MKKKSFLLLLLFYSSTLSAQNIERVHQYLDTLCAPGLNGRGADADGQKNAARYLVDRFKEMQIAPLQESSYFQKFHYDINTFPGKLFLQADQTILQPGTEFIIHSSSPSGKGTVKLVWLDTILFSSSKAKKKFLQADFKNTALVYDEKFLRLLKAKPSEMLAKIEKAACVVELKDKLTMGLSSTQASHPVFEVLKEKFDRKAKTLTYEVEARLLKNYEAQNVCAIIPGTVVPDSFLFLTAHYDHLGSLGSANYFPGANDNASGVSMLLELARYFKENPTRYSIVFIAFGAEEAGLIGSKYFTQNPLVPLSRIRFLINMDLMGTGDDGMMVVNGQVFTKEFSLLTSINDQKLYLSTIKKRGKAANSDHYFFTEKGVPAFFFYTLGGIAAYHDVQDKPQTLPLTKFREVYLLITEFVPLVIALPR